MCERREGVNRSDVFKREVHYKAKGVYANIENGGDGYGGEEIVEGGRMEVRMGAKGFVCGDENREEDVSAITDELWLTGGRTEVEEGRQMGFQRIVGLEQSRALIVLWCAADLRLEVQRYCVLKRLWACSEMPTSLKCSPSKGRISSMMRSRS